MKMSNSVILTVYELELFKIQLILQIHKFNGGGGGAGGRGAQN